MKDNYMIDLDSLTEEERQQITAVLKKDEELKHAQDAKINELKTSINAIRMNAVLKPGEDESKICKRCREPFGYFFNTGDFCSTCKCKVCKTCREFIASSQWICVLCYKQRQLKGLTGEWIVPLRERNENEEPVSVPELVRKSLRKKSNEEKDPHSNYGSSGSSSPTELRFPGESDVHMLSALLAQNNVHTSEDPGDQNIVVKVESKRYIDSDTDDDDVTVSNGPNSSNTLHGSISALSTGRQSSSDQEDATRDGNGFHFDDSAYRPHSDLPDLDELRQKYKSHHSPLSSMTSSPTPSTIGQRLMDLASSVENSDADTIFFSNCNNDLDKLSMTYGAEATPFSGRIACKLRPKSASQSSADSEVNPKCQSVQFQREFYQLSYGSCSSGPSSSPDRSSTPVNLSGRSSPFSPSPEAVDNTDISSIQSDSGNVTPASNDDINSQGHSKSPSEISSPSITISPAEEEEEEDHLSDDTSSIQQNTYQKTFGGLFSALGGSRESIASYYSQTGGGSYGVVEVKGAIQFAVDYNHKAGVLEIIVKQASELAAVDKKKGTSNPYVKTYLLPDRTESGKRKTHFKKNCLDPVFNETLKYLVTKSELSNRTLWLSVWNHTVLGKAVFLGEVTLPLTYFTYSSLPQWYTLQDRNEVDPSFVTYKGELSLSVKYIPLENMADTKEKSGKKKVKVKAKEGQLCVLIKKAKNLTPVHSNGSSNPFCKGYFLPQVSKGSKQKTETMKHNLNPSWNYLLTYDNVSYEELANRCMEITVWDQDRFAHNTFLGGVRLSLGTGQSNGKDVTWMNSNEEEISVWASIIEKPNTWVNATLTLRDQMD